MIQLNKPFITTIICLSLNTLSQLLQVNTACSATS